ncbi:MAG: nucleoid-associated protein [Bacteroidales bacterium]|nr:nucleoid-associated protein [Bacteroidales bacterium]
MMKINTSNTIIESLAIHFVGNKNNDENLVLSKDETSFTDEMETLLIEHLISAFKFDEFYQFYHETELELNEVFTYVSKIFADNDELYEQSRNLAMHLFKQTTHPKIKAGEFYTIYFRDCEIDGQMFDAIGLFKTETKDAFFKLSEEDDNFNLDVETGINLKKPDKGCIIFNMQKDDGYFVTMVDRLGKGSDAAYWIDDFLNVQNRKDEYFQTKNVMSFCKNYVHDKLPEKYEVSKADQADLLNKSIKYFKESEIFDVNMFADEVIQDPEIIKDFKTYKSDYEKENDVDINQSFEISGSAVKNQSRFFKSKIKLDKNFHIYVHGKRDYIEKGFDASTGLNYYKLYFENEE